LYRLGKYQLVARLGTGGMAEVWKARLIEEPRAAPVVIKRVLPGHAHDSSFAKSLRIEAQVLTHLRHPAIVALHALEEIDGQMLLVLEHVDGCDLRALMSALGAQSPPPGFGAYVAHQVCLALGHAHRFAGSDGRVRAILHRDVSPSNVMLTRDGAVKLVDFGIAKALMDVSDEVTRSRSIKGKLGYMAPEQLAGAALDCPADVYGAGVLLHELLAGRRLFTVNSPGAMAMVREARIPAPSSINPAVPASLDAICLRALAREPGDRFRDGQEMAEALAPILPGLAFTRAELTALVARMPAAAHESAGPGTVTVPSKDPLGEAPTAPARGAPPARARARWPLFAIAAALALVAGYALWLLPRSPAPAASGDHRGTPAPGGSAAARQTSESSAMRPATTAEGSAAREPAVTPDPAASDRAAHDPAGGAPDPNVRAAPAHVLRAPSAATPVAGPPNSEMSGRPPRAGVRTPKAVRTRAPETRVRHLDDKTIAPF
jgi:hypothetical protein